MSRKMSTILGIFVALVAILCLVLGKWRGKNDVSGFFLMVYTEANLAKTELGDHSVTDSLVNRALCL